MDRAQGELFCAHGSISKGPKGGSSRGEGLAVPFPVPTAIRTPAQSSVLAFIEQNMNYSTRPEQVKKKNDLLVMFSRSFRGMFLYTMDTTSIN